MARKALNGKIGPKHRRVLKLLAKSPRGRTNPKFFARFMSELLDLLLDGLAIVVTETVTAHGRSVEIARVQITDEGRRIIGDTAESE